MSTRILSVFVDESGDFGPYESHSPYYIVSLVIHDQQINISENINIFDKRLFNALFNFARKLNFRYFCLKVQKKECPDVISITSKLAKLLSNRLRENEIFWNNYDKVIIYYDNGQIELTKILTSVFNTLYTHVEFRKVTPIDYKLFQVADLICTLELLAEKAESNSFTNSELEFFDNIRTFKKNYLKPIRKKEL